MDRAALLTTVENAFAARVRGDAEAAAAYFAPGATFRFAGEQSLARAYLGDGSEYSLESAVGRIIELVEMTARETIDALVDGNRCGLLSRATVSFGGREPFETTLFHIFELDDQGRIASVLEFADTARIGRELVALAG